jgi:hypothetical protein
MSVTPRTWLVLLLVVGTFLLTLPACSGPITSRDGTPAFYWAAAKGAYAAGDYARTLQNLDHLADTKNDYSERALTWSLVLSSGLTSGYVDLADAYSAGARANKSQAAHFQRKAAEYRALAGRMALQFAQTFEKVDVAKDNPVQLAFGYPRGSVAPSPLIHEIAAGVVLQPVDMEAAQYWTIDRGVLLSACRVAGASNDPARALAFLGRAGAVASRPMFLTAMANSLYSASQLYTRDKLDDPRRVVFFCLRAQQALKFLPSSEAVSALGMKIQDALKISART